MQDIKFLTELEGKLTFEAKDEKSCIIYKNDNVRIGIYSANIEDIKEYCINNNIDADFKLNLEYIKETLQDEFKNLDIVIVDNVVKLGDSGLFVKLENDGKMLVKDRHFPRTRRENLKKIIEFLNTCHRYY